VRYFLALAGTFFSHPLCSPGVWTWLQVIFTCSHLKQFYGGTLIGSDKETKNTVKEKLTGLAADFYDTAM
jgi:hypothetical protein